MSTPTIKLINLKEAFHYQSYLKQLLDSAVDYVSIIDNVTETTELHRKSLVNPDAEDEIIEILLKDKMPHSVKDIIGFIEFVLCQRDKLASAISAAKKAASIDIDSACALNKSRREVARRLLDLSRMRNCTGKEYGRDYKFNAEGNQVSYCYVIEKNQTAAFDRKNVRNLADGLLHVAESTSTAIDDALLNTKIEYNMPFTLNCSWEEALDTYVGIRQQIEARKAAEAKAKAASATNADTSPLSDSDTPTA